MADSTPPDSNDSAQMESTRRDMEVIANDLKDLILTQPPADLLGYIWAQLLLGSMEKTDGAADFSSMRTSATTHDTDERLSNAQLILEYAHAAWASFGSDSSKTLDENVCAEIFDAAARLKGSTLAYCMLTAADTSCGAFGAATRDFEFYAKSNWVLIRGHRYQVLEREFYEFVLTAHDDALVREFGVGATEIARGIQDIADAMRLGHMRAAKTLFKHSNIAQKISKRHGISIEEAGEVLGKSSPETLSESESAFNDLFKGFVCNVSKHTRLPPQLLDALSYEEGEGTDFFSPGDLSGSPLRTLPARIKPLLRIGNDYFATDPSFVRDASYRAILWNLLQKSPTYKSEFERRQKEMSERAFQRILARQLSAARIDCEVWYRDPLTKQWCENDVLIRIDDVLMLVEAKAGAAATIASPATDFDRHIRSVQDLVVKAYGQCRRLFQYISSDAPVPLFKREGGSYVEFDRIRLRDFRVALPIGLTVESFSPYSTMCKELPQISPILDRHPFISLSIEDLFVLGRILPTAGQLTHYLTVRQRVAGIRTSSLYDELDHLGAYIEKNRIDAIMLEHEAAGVDLTVWDGFSSVLDQHFSGTDWGSKPPPSQPFPVDVSRLLEALDKTRAFGWLTIDSYIRDLGAEARTNLGRVLQEILPTLNAREYRYFVIDSQPPLFVWVQRAGKTLKRDLVRFKASAAALAAGVATILSVIIRATAKRRILGAERVLTPVVSAGDPTYDDIRAEATRMLQRRKQLPPPRNSASGETKNPLPGRNAPCWCGSGRKFKRCHG